MNETSGYRARLLVGHLFKNRYHRAGSVVPVIYGAESSKIVFRGKVVGEVSNTELAPDTKAPIAGKSIFLPRDTRRLSRHVSSKKSGQIAVAMGARS